MNSLNWTNISTRATVGASVRIDFVNIALRDSFNGTFINAGTTSGTVI
jgi:hypothetical protein